MKKEKLQNVKCVKCGKEASVDITDQKPYNKTTKSYWCNECINRAVDQINQGTYDPYAKRRA